MLDAKCRRKRHPLPAPSDGKVATFVPPVCLFVIVTLFVVTKDMIHEPPLHLQPHPISHAFVCSSQRLRADEDAVGHACRAGGALLAVDLQSSQVPHVLY